jgi:hypothetical protein
MVGRLLVGLSGISYGLEVSPFLNWAKVDGTFGPTVGRSAGGSILRQAAYDDGYLDANGDLVSPCPTDVTYVERVFYAKTLNSGPKLSSTPNGEPFRVKWDGRGCTMSVPLIGNGSVVADNPNGTALVTLGSTSNNLSVRFTITDRFDPPYNIRIYQTRYESNFNAGEKFNPDWLAEVAKFPRFRTMDWQGTNFSSVINFSDIATEAFCAWGSNRSDFPKRSTPLSLIVALAHEAESDPWVCIPYKATDACVQGIAEYFRDNLNSTRTLIVEYSNEAWNFDTGYYSGLAASVGLPAGNNPQYYGYRAAQVMKIFRDVFNDRSRWRGVIGTQTVNADGVTAHAITGINYWRANVLSPANSLAVSDLFDEIAVTCYFGDVIGANQITAISQETSALVTASNNFVNGNQVRFTMFPANAMPEMDGLIGIVSSRTATNFRVNINTTGFTAFVNPGSSQAHVEKAGLYLLIEDSIDANDTDPINFPTIYTYFSQQVAESFMTGTCSSGHLITNVHITNLVSTFWPAQEAYAEDNGLILTQYEGGNHLVGSTLLTAGGDNSGGDLLNPWIIESGHSQEVADVYTAAYQEWFDAGRTFPAKFTMDGFSSKFGTWAGIRWWPCEADEDGDFDNPVWLATLEANAAVDPTKIRIKWA